MSLSANYHDVEKIVQQLRTELEQTKHERDAAIKDMQLTTITLCAVCRHRMDSPCPVGTYHTDDCVTLGCNLFEWRGVQKET